MKQYHDLLVDIRDNGSGKDDRTGTGTRSLFGRQMRFDLSQGFPLLTTKKVYLRSIIHELIWLVSGNTSLKYLADNDVHIWDEWPLRNYVEQNTSDLKGLEVGSHQYKEAIYKHRDAFLEKIKTDSTFCEKWGDLGPVYGKQWRAWLAPDGRVIDQLANAIDQIKTNPTSRRIIVNAWNAADIDKMTKAGLPPCHTMYQFYVSDGKLSCQLYQRSADVFLGVPFNIASYALLTMMIAQVCDLKVGEFVHTFGDVHIYNNHIDQVNEQLSREPKALPQMILNPKVKNIDDFVFEDFTLEGYDPHPPIKAPIAI